MRSCPMAQPINGHTAQAGTSGGIWKSLALLYLVYIQMLAFMGAHCKLQRSKGEHLNGDGRVPPFPGLPSMRAFSVTS